MATNECLYLHKICELINNNYVRGTKSVIFFTQNCVQVTPSHMSVTQTIQVKWNRNTTLRWNVENNHLTSLQMCICVMTVWHWQYISFTLQLRNILQQVDYYLNKSGKREGKLYIFIYCFYFFILNHAFGHFCYKYFKKVWHSTSVTD